MPKKCPKCGTTLKPPDASYCITCESYLDVKHVKKKKSKEESGKTYCCLTTFFFVAFVITGVVWLDTPVGSVEEFITEIIGLFFVYGFFILMSILMSERVCAQIDKKTKRDKPGVDLSFLKSDKRFSYLIYYAFVLIIILISLISFSVKRIRDGLLLFYFLYSVLAIVSFTFFIIKSNRVKYWIEEKDFIALFALQLIIIEQWGIGDLSFYGYLFGIIEVFVWTGWVIKDVVRGRIKPIKLIGITGPALVLVGLILESNTLSITSLFTMHLGFYLWTGFFSQNYFKEMKYLDWM